MYTYDLASTTFSSVHPDYVKSVDLWETDYYSAISPDGSRVLWTKRTLENVVVGYGALAHWDSYHSEYYVSDAQFIEALRVDNERPRVLVWLNEAFLRWEQTGPIYDEEGKYLDQISFAISEGERLDSYQLLGTFKYVNLSSLTTSPDLRYVLFYVTRDRGLDHDYLLVDMVEREARGIHTGAGGFPSWHPDSQLFTIGARHEDEAYVHIYDVGKEELHPLTPGYKAAWSPNGEWIAFIRGVSKDRRIYIIKPDGSHEVELPDSSPRSFYWVGWSPDSSFLYYLSMQQSCCPRIDQLRKINIESGEVTIMLEFEEMRGLGNPPILKWSPDGNWALFKHNVRDVKSGGMWVARRKWHLCNDQSCIELQPDYTIRCPSMDWLGPFSH